MGALKYYDTTNSSWEYVDQPGGANSFVYKEAISGVDGTATAFTTARGYIPGTLQVFVNGLAQGPTHITETTPSSGVFTLDTAPESTGVVTVNYQINIPPSGNADTLDGNHLSAILEALYPVGAVYISGSSTMPALIAGIGTWARLKGRVIVGVDETQTEFDTVDETGGHKELQAHTHTVQTVDSTGGAYNGLLMGSVNGQYDAQQNYFTTTSAGNGNSGNLQPYKAKYMWERTA